MTRSILSKQSRKQKQEYKSIWENKDKDMQNLIGFMDRNSEHVRLSKQMGMPQHALHHLLHIQSALQDLTLLVQAEISNILKGINKE